MQLTLRRTQWPRGLRRWSAAARLLGLRVRIPPQGAWMSVSCECCVLCRWRSLRRADLSSREVLLNMVSECDRGTSQRRPGLTGGCRDMIKKFLHYGSLFGFSFGLSLTKVNLKFKRIDPVVVQTG